MCLILKWNTNLSRICSCLWWCERGLRIEHILKKEKYFIEKKYRKIIKRRKQKPSIFYYSQENVSPSPKAYPAHPATYPACYAESTTPRIGDSGSRRLLVSVIRGVTVSNRTSEFSELSKMLNHACKGPIWQKVSRRFNVLSQIVYWKVWKKGYSNQSCRLPAINNARSQFCITNSSANSKPKSERL